MVGFYWNSLLVIIIRCQITNYFLQHASFHVIFLLGYSFLNPLLKLLDIEEICVFISRQVTRTRVSTIPHEEHSKFNKKMYRWPCFLCYFYIISLTTAYFSLFLFSYFIVINILQSFFGGNLIIICIKYWTANRIMVIFGP